MTLQRQTWTVTNVVPAVEIAGTQVADEREHSSDELDDSDETDKYFNNTLINEFIADTRENQFPEDRRRPWPSENTHQQDQR